MIFGKIETEKKASREKKPDFTQKTMTLKLDELARFAPCGVVCRESAEVVGYRPSSSRIRLAREPGGTFPFIPPLATDQDRDRRGGRKPAIQAYRPRWEKLAGT